MRIHYLFLASALALGAPAFAQDAPPADDAKPFDGFYVGGTVGYDAQPNDRGSSIFFDRNLDGNFNETVTTATGANAFAPTAAQPGAGFCNGRATSNGLLTGCTNDKDNISYSARVGFDKQYGNLVVGAVGEFGKSQVRDSVSAFSTTPANYVMTRKVDFNANLRLRGGYAAKTTLFYATGGGAYAQINSSFTTTNTANAFTQRGDKGAWGFVAGGGIEQKISRHFSIGLEYLYNQYQDDSYRVRVGSTGTTPATNPFILAPNTTGTDFRRSDKTFNWHSVRVAANFRF